MQTVGTACLESTEQNLDCQQFLKPVHANIFQFPNVHLYNLVHVYTEQHCIIMINEYIYSTCALHPALHYEDILL